MKKMFIYLILIMSMMSVTLAQSKTKQQDKKLNEHEGVQFLTIAETNGFITIGVDDSILSSNIYYCVKCNMIYVKVLGDWACKHKKGDHHHCAEGILQDLSFLVNSIDLKSNITANRILTLPDKTNVDEACTYENLVSALKKATDRLKDPNDRGSEFLYSGHQFISPNPNPTKAEVLRKQAEEIEKESKEINWIRAVLRNCDISPKLRTGTGEIVK